MIDIMVQIHGFSTTDVRDWIAYFEQIAGKACGGKPEWHNIVDEGVVGRLSHFVTEHEDISAVRQDSLVIPWS
jgi:hypothetical protein